MPQAKPSMRQQHNRQRARDEQRIVEPIVEERNIHVWFDEPAIDGVERARRHKQWIAHVSKPLHSNARMISPNPSPIEIFKNKTISFTRSARGGVATNLLSGGPSPSTLRFKHNSRR